MKKKSERRRRRSVDDCKVGGLGAFVGITRETIAPDDLSKESLTRRFVSPLESNLRKTPAMPGHDQTITPSIQVEGLTVNNSASEVAPPVNTSTLFNKRAGYKKRREFRFLYKKKDNKTCFYKKQLSLGNSRDP